MADETRTAEVSLTADVTGYTQPLGQAYTQTNNMIAAVNKLSTSMEGLTKRIGKKLLWFTAADVAALTAFTMVSARYEKQLTTLRAQTALNNKDMAVYTSGIKTLTKELPVTRGEMVALITQINQLGVTSERETVKMARVFTNLAAATGEDVGALTQGMIELSRQMGTLAGGGQMMSNFSDSLTTVSNSAGVAATSVLNFAQSISPFARAAGIGQAELLGISAAFTKAGADGFAAANTFNSIIADITRQIQNGSPEIAKYANVVGVTIEQFKQMTMTERISSIFEAVNAAGPDAVRILDRLGQDGIRAAKSIAAVSNEAGGLRAAVERSVDAYGSGSTQKGANAAFDSLDSKLTMLKNQMEILGTAIGDAVLPPAKALLGVFNNMATQVSGFLEPLLKAAGAMGMILAPFTAAAGTLMTMMGPLSTLMMAFMAFRLSPMRSFLEGAKSGAAAQQGLPYSSPFADKMKAWRDEQAAAAAAGRAPNTALRPAFYQRWGFGAGEVAGGTRAGVGISRFSMPSLRALGTATADLTRTFAEGTRMWYQDAPRQDWWNRRSIFRGLDNTIARTGGVMSSAWGALANPGQAGFLQTFRDNVAKANAALTVNTTNTTANTASKGGNTVANATNSKGLLATANAYMRNAGTLQAFNAALLNATKSLAMLPLAAGRFGLRAGGQIIGGTARGINALLGGLGGIVGGGAGTGAVLAGAIGLGYAAKEAADKNNQFIVRDDTLTNLGPTNIALGRATETLSSFTMKVDEAKREVTSLGQASRLTKEEIRTAQQEEYADQRVAGLTNAAAGVSYMQSLGPLDPEQMRRVMMDITKRFGMDMADTIRQAYMDQTKNGQFPYGGNLGGMAGSSAGLLLSAVESTNQGFVGGMRNHPLLGNLFRLNVDDNTNQQMGAIWAAIEQNAADVGAKYGAQSGDLMKFMDAFDILDQSFIQARSGDAGGNAALEQSIANFESMLGAELGLTKTANGYRSGLGENMTSSEELMNWMWTANEAGAKNFRDQMETLGIQQEDYWNNARGLRRDVFDRSTGQLSDFETRLRRTQLGEFSRESASVLSVTEGDKIGDAVAIRKAVDEMVAAAYKNKDASGGLTTEFQNLKNSVVDVNDPLYQLAGAAMQAAQAQEQYRAQAGGWTQEFLTRWDQISEQMATPNLQEDEKSQLVNERRALTGDLRERFKSIVMSLREFNISQERARESFDRSMKRSIEDASQSWMSTATRAANQQAPTNSPWLLQYNAGEILDTVQGQLGSLRDLRKRGLSDKAINMLNLTDPSMGYQAKRLSDQASADEIKAFNRLAAQREKAVEALTKEFSKPFSRAEEDFKIATNQAIEDMIRMGDEASGTIKELSAEATALAEQLGVADMAALAKALEVYGKLPGIDEENKEKDDKTRAQWAEVDRWTGRAREEKEKQTKPSAEPQNPYLVSDKTEITTAGVTAWVESMAVNVNKTDYVPPKNPLETVPNPVVTAITREDRQTSSTSGYRTPVGQGASTTTRSTYNNGTTVNVNGSVSVVAENPAHMANKLKQMARQEAMKAGAAAPS